jgi:hypothetical protein
MRSPEALAQAQLDAYNAQDLDAFCACYADDVEVWTLGAAAPVGKGMEGFRRTYAELFASSPALRCRLVKRIVTGRFVVDEESLTGHATRGAFGATAIYETRDGKITKVWFITPSS